MKSKTSIDTFYFGRLNLLKDSKGQKKDIYELLRFGFKHKKHNTIFGIFKVHKMNDSELGTIIYGQLAKYSEFKEEPVVDKKNNEITSIHVPDVVLGQSEFFLLEKTHLIAFNPYGRIIDIPAFCEAFSAIIIGADDSFYVDSKIYPVVQEYVFLDYLKKMQIIKRISFSLSPSNPNNRDLWEEIDDKLRNRNVAKYKEDMEAVKNKSIVIDKEIESKIAMAADGYGTATSEGKDEDGIDTKISTNKKETMVSKEIQSNSQPEEKISALKQVFNSILSRFAKNSL